MPSSVPQKDHQDYSKWIKIEDVHTVMATVPSYKKILFLDGKTNLLDCITSMEKPSILQEFLHDIVDINTALPSNSPLWPGCTPLHLAVMFSETIKNENKSAHLVVQFLDHGASIQVQNRRDATPLHLAFHLELPHVVAVLLRHLEIKTQFCLQELVNRLDDDKLSFLHIFCTDSDHHSSLARKLLSDKRKIQSTVNVAYEGKELADVKPGWTPLHVASHKSQLYLVELLLQQGADLLRTDARGFTAIHLLFGTSGAEQLANVLFASEQLRDCVVEGVGLTHLHVAVWCDNCKAVERLLDSGANIEATIEALEDRDLMNFVGCTPLHLAVHANCYAIARILLQRGANVFTRSHSGTSPLFKALTGSQKTIRMVFINLIWGDGKLQTRMEEELGVTMLHIACHIYDLGEVEAQLKKGADVNARVYGDSNFWMRCTPLHLLIAASESWEKTFSRYRSAREIFKELVQHGSDVNLEDGAGKTAFHVVLTLKSCYYICEATPQFLLAGADINTVDKNGKSAISYAFELYSTRQQWEFETIDNIVFKFMLHTCKMKLVGLDVNEPDESLALARVRFKFPLQSAFYDQVQATERVKIGQRGLTLRSFLYETCAISLYPSLTPRDRDEVDAFFRKVNDRSFPEVSPLLKLQYSKAVARLSLIDPARDSLKSFICSSFPDLCVDKILRYLSNLQMKQLLRASIDV